MKKLFIAAALLASTMSFGQSNTPGTIHVGLGWGVLLGGAKITSTVDGESDSEKGVGARSNYGLRASYGLANAFSLGLFLRSESAGYVVTSTDFGSSSQTVFTRGLGVGLEPKVYAVNKDKFNLYFALPIGFSTGKAYSSLDVSKTNPMSGLNYGLNAGFNWYWAKFIGMSLDLGYSGVSLSGKQTIEGFGDPIEVKTKISGGGIYFGLGLVTKFGGK